MYRKPDLTNLSVCWIIIQQSQKLLLPGKKYQQLKAPALKLKKYQQLKAQAFKQMPHKLKEQGGKDEAHLESDLRQESAFNFDGKVNKEQLLKQKEERKEVLYRHRTKAKAKIPAKGGACGIPLLAHDLLGNKKASHPVEEPRIKEVKK